ncbi:ATP-binding protein [Streptomyces sp. NPDC006854]|uniref:ATP-binding protein n=1 Tax=Streptomyces sp. NPDC006854 TaxID=3155115 RepID=UPI0033FD1208
MIGPASQRPTATRAGGLVEEHFSITKRSPGERPPPVDESRVRAMRLVTRASLTSRGLTCVADDATLVVSELITNAIVHSGGRHIRLTLDVCNGVLRIRVHDGVAGPRPTAQCPKDDDEHGRGLMLVREIARSRQGSWGVSDNGATTWCELSLVAC